MVARAESVTAPDARWSESTERVLRLLYAVGISVGAMVLVVGAAVEDRGSRTLIASILTIATLLGSGYVALRHGFRADVSRLLAVVGTALLLIGGNVSALSALAVPAFLAYAALSVRSLIGLAAVVVAPCAYAVMSYSLFDDADLSLLIVDAMGRISAVITIVMLSRMLRNGAERSEAKARAAADQRRIELSATARMHEQRWVDRFLHDSLVHALKAITLASHLSRVEVEAAARSASADVERLGGSGRALDLAATIRMIAEESGLDCHLDVETVVVPVSVATALAESTREALRNVRQHSGESQASVALRRRSRGCSLIIQDSGRGFDVDELPSGHYGVRGLIDRMADVGGDATVSSGSSGTTVALQWQPRALEPREWSERSGVRAVVLACGVSFLSAGVVQAVLVRGRLLHGALALVVTLMVAVLWVLAAVVTGQRHLGRLAAVLLGVCAVSCAAVGACCVEPDSAEPIQCWWTGYPLILLLFVAAHRPLREYAFWGCALAVTPSAVLTFRGATMGDFARLAPVLGSPAVGVSIVLASVALSRRVFVEEQQRESEARRSADREVRARRREQLLQERVGGLRERIVPFLTDVAAGRADCFDPSVQRRAAVYEAHGRDGLGGPTTIWPQSWAGIVEQLRWRGGQVSLSRHVPTTAAQVQVVAATLAEVQRSGLDNARVAVRVMGSPSGTRATVTITPYAPLLAQALHRLISNGPGVLATDQDSYLAVTVSESAVACPSRAEIAACGDRRKKVRIHP